MERLQLEGKKIMNFTLPDSMFNEKDLIEMGILQDEKDLIDSAHKNRHIEMLKSGKEVINGSVVDASISWQIIKNIYNVVQYRCGIICAYVYDDFTIKSDFFTNTDNLKTSN